MRAVFFLFPLLLLTGCQTTHRWQQEIAIVVATPDGPVHASVVQSVSVKVQWAITDMLIGNYGRQVDLKGEALAAPLGEGKMLFALVDSGFLVERAGLVDYRRGMGSAIRRLRAQGPVELIGREELAVYDRPTLVTFGDLNDPSSLEVVDPDNFAATFGPGYELQSMTIALVDAPRTQGVIEVILPWLEEHGRERFYIVDKPDGLNAPVPDRYTITPRRFDTELYR